MESIHEQRLRVLRENAKADEAKEHERRRLEQERGPVTRGSDVPLRPRPNSVENLPPSLDHGERLHRAIRIIRKRIRERFPDCPQIDLAFLAMVRRLV